MHTERWEIDSSHSGIHFSVRHLVIAKVRGQFSRWTGAVVVPDGDFTKASVEAVVDASSIDTGVADRDAHLRGPDFFDAERHPVITFRSRGLEGDFGREGDRFRAIGDLTIRDSTMEVVLDCTFEGRGTDPWGKERAGFSARTEIDRREWGLRWNQTIETGGVLVANRVRIEAEVQFVRD